jgi:hypothetical protein
MVVSGGLKSCTAEVNVATMVGGPPHGNYQLNLIDTPGFDDTIETDFAILTKIATWLKDSYVVLEVYKPYKLIRYHSYKQGAKLGGVIYLHDITTPRFDGPARRNLEIFRNLCGRDALDHVVLGTTKWGLNVPGSEENQRELETKYWKPLIERGAQVRRFDGSRESAQSLIDAIISTPVEQPLNQTVLQIESVMSGPSSYTRAGAENLLRRFWGLFRKRRTYQYTDAPTS